MLYEYLKRRILQNPDNVLEDGPVSLSFRELISHAEKLGSRLTQPKYGILCRSELHTAIALLACLYAGKTAVPLSWRYGEKHVQKLMDSAKLSHLLTDQGMETVCTAIPEKEDLSDVALIMCTSGTTGAPKGAMITEENLLTNLTDIAGYFPLENKDRILIARPLYHCAVLTGEFLISLLKGAHILFVSEGFNPLEILRLAKEKGITALCGTPTLLYHISKMNLRSSQRLALRVMAVSGECMTPVAARTMREAFPDAQIFNVYGLTEASPRVCYLPADKFDSHPLAVGFPLPSLETRIVDQELQIRGKSVMKGYYDDPDATRQVIQDGWLHTGDIAEQDASGLLYIRCRRDNMIIRSGMNIYPQEIENALKGDDRITEAAAFGVRDDTVGQKIHLQVVTSLTKSEVFSLCKQKLPSYQLPDSIEILQEIPRNASGKIIRGKDEHRVGL